METPWPRRLLLVRKRNTQACMLPGDVPPLRWPAAQ